MPFDGKDSKSIAAAIEAGKYCLDPEVGWLCWHGGARRQGSAGCRKEGEPPSRPGTAAVQIFLGPSGHLGVAVFLTRAPAFFLPRDNARAYSCGAGCQRRQRTL
jgi:hypothetical protein